MLAKLRSFSIREWAASNIVNDLMTYVRFHLQGNDSHSEELKSRNEWVHKASVLTVMIHTKKIKTYNLFNVWFKVLL
jgi:hypothetical protein